MQRKILLVTDSRSYQSIFQFAFSELNYELVICQTGNDALNLAKQQTIDFVCADFYLQDMEGIDLCRVIRKITGHALIPFILMTTVEAQNLLKRALPSGVTDIFNKKEIEKLIAFIKRFPVLNSEMTGRVLLIEDSNSQREYTKHILERHGLQVDAFAAAEKALEQFLQTDYDLVITDIVLDGMMSGLALVNFIRRQLGEKGDIPILAVTAFDDETRRVQLFHLGVTEYIVKPLIDAELFTRVKSLVSKKRMASELRRREQDANFRMICDSLPEQIWTALPNGKLDYVNKRILDYFGFPVKQMLDEGWEHVIHPEDLQCYKDAWAEALAKQTFFEIDFRLKHFNEGYHWHISRAIPHRDKHGRIDKWYGSNTDISVRKNLEERLKVANLIYQYSNQGMMLTDSDSRILAVNAAFTRITGYTEEEIVGQPTFILSSHRHDAEFYNAMQKAIDEIGYWQGEVWNMHKSGYEYAEWLTINTIKAEHESVIQYIALFSDITEKKKADELIWTQANYDSLTALPNRRLFADRLQHEMVIAQRKNYRLAILFIDLDRFKEVNDSLGHHIGDLLLIETAARINGVIRKSDTLARQGGDEFTLIINEFDEIAFIDQICQNIINVLAMPFELAGEKLYISASIGITIFPDDAKEVNDLLKYADQAMYAAKHEGRNQYHYFTSGMQVSALWRQRLSVDLRSAINVGELFVYYQPIVEISTGKIYKAEALMRWKHRELGFISPSDFIPIAEDTGVINSIGDWLFREVAEQIKYWRENYLKDFQVSVNKSPVQFREAIYKDWLSHLQKLNLDEDSVVIEITEGVLLKASKNVSDCLADFRKSGIKLALDDFGTGYSSLAYLNKFEIDYLKIDKSFVCNLAPNSSDLALCDAIIVMAHKLGIQVIAEGIETQEQRNLLAQIGCDYGQGFWYSQPIPAADFEQLLRKNSD